MLFFSNGYLRERIEYRERLVKLKWDAWFYVTGVDMIINLATVLFVILGVILFIFSIQGSYVDPFSNMKTMYNIMNGIFIAGLIGLNIYFIFKEQSQKIVQKK